MDYEQLKLENQLCFPLYALSRLITREYQPYFDKIGITYSQYLVFMVLWEQENGLTVNEISRKLILNTNTVTPLLQRMEKLGFIERQRSQIDERKVLVLLTEKGKQLRVQAAEIPLKLAAKIMCGPLEQNELIALKEQLCKLLDFLNRK